jgi:hypothetical protein
MKREAIAAILVTLNDELERLNPMSDADAFDRNRQQIDVVMKAYDAIENVRAEDVEMDRLDSFNGSGGALSWCGRSFALHPDRCTCQEDDPIPHRHYGQAPYSCARCKCEAYAPIKTDAPLSPGREGKP